MRRSDLVLFEVRLFELEEFSEQNKSTTCDDGKETAR